MLIKKPKIRRLSQKPRAVPYEFIGYDFEALGLSPWTDHATQAGFVRYSNTIEPESELEVNISLSDYSVPGPDRCKFFGPF
jgi:hypothetical protein